MKWSEGGGSTQAVLISQKNPFVLVWRGGRAVSSRLWVLHAHEKVPRGFMSCVWCPVGSAGVGCGFWGLDPRWEPPPRVRVPMCMQHSVIKGIWVSSCRWCWCPHCLCPHFSG